MARAVENSLRRLGRATQSVWQPTSVTFSSCEGGPACWIVLAICASSAGVLPPSNGML
ncbi:Uncharacterised protein [Bordetella pertussis]|nr:Uncharacterised protein [Bordetella pertussis]